MADAAPAISNGFERVFGSYRKRGMCFFHVKVAVEKKMSILNDDKLSIEILTDIFWIQKSQTENVFYRAIELFNEKYKMNENTNITTFLAYFNKQWVEFFPGWYEGFIGYWASSTNNGLESLNGRIKKYQTLRNQLPLNEFIESSFKMIKNWSLDRSEFIPLLNEKNKNYIPYYSKPHLVFRDYVQAWKWREKLFINANKKESRRKTINKVSSDFLNIYTKSGIGRQYSDEIDDWELDEWLEYETMQNWKDLDEFIVIHNSIIETKIPIIQSTNILSECRCSCTDFYKMQKCKHIIGKNTFIALLL